MIHAKFIPLLALSLTLFACSQERDVESVTANQQHTTPMSGAVINFSLKANIPASEARAMAFYLGDAGSQLQMTEENMPSVVVIANADKSKVYYAQPTWTKTLDSNHLSFSGELTNLETGTAIQLPQGDWYITGVVGGTYDATNKRVTFDPNGSTLQAIKQGSTMEKPVPVHFPWTKLTFTSSNDVSVECAFQALGMMMRVELTNDMADAVRYKSITYQSNVLSTASGYYDLSTSALPATTGTLSLRDGASTVSVPAYPTWVSSGTEPSYTFTAEGSSTTALDVVVNAGATYDKYFLVWAVPKATEELGGSTTVGTMPTGLVTYTWNSSNQIVQATNDPTSLAKRFLVGASDAYGTGSASSKSTHIMANAVRLVNNVEQAQPKMSGIYIWGSQQIPSQTAHTRVLQRTHLIRPKMALEYFDTDYMRTDYHNYANTTIGSTTYTYYTGTKLKERIEKTQSTSNNPYNIYNNSAEWRGISSSSTMLFFDSNHFSQDGFLQSSTEAQQWKVPTDKELRAWFLPSKSANLSVTTTTVFPITDSVTINGETDRYYDWYVPGSIYYALRFVNGTNQQLSAWRYTVSNAGYSTAECIYLGPNFRGTLTDIQQESFWTLHKDDIVSRTYQTSMFVLFYKSYILYSYISRSLAGAIHNTGTTSPDQVFFLGLIGAAGGGESFREGDLNVFIGGFLTNRYYFFRTNFIYSGLRTSDSGYTSIVLLQKPGTGW